MNIPYYKIVGGYTALIKWRGRWHFLGHTARELIEVTEAAKAAGHKLVRQPAPPRARMYCSLRAYKEAFPQFKKEWMEP